MELMEKVTFDAKNHKYYVDGVEYISVHEFLGLFSTPFDSDKISKKISQKNGETKEKVLSDWEKKRNFGTECHKFAQLVLNPDPNKVFPKEWEKTPQFRAIYDFIKKNKLKNPICEEIIYDPEFHLAGTPDLIAEWDGKLCLFDWKSDNKIDSFNYGKFFKYPINNLPESKLNFYMLQKSIYQYMLRKRGIMVEEMYILHIKNDIVEPIRIIPALKEVSEMLRVWKTSGFNKKDLYGVKERMKKVNVQRLGMCCNQAHDETNPSMKVEQINNWCYNRAKELYYLYDKLEKEIEEEINHD